MRRCGDVGESIESHVAHRHLALSLVVALAESFCAIEQVFFRYRNGIDGDMCGAIRASGFGQITLAGTVVTALRKRNLMAVQARRCNESRVRNALDKAIRMQI